MAKLDLRKFVETDGGSIDPIYVGYNFERLDLVSEVLKDVDQGTITVTGTTTVSTALTSVEGVCVSLVSPPIAGACFVTASVVPNSGQITITVYSNTFVLAAVACNIQYVAVGVMTL